MARKQEFLDAEFADRFKESYAALSNNRQRGTDRVILAILKQAITPGMRIKPIQPEKYYAEARINEGDRLVFRREDRRVVVVDVVEHDHIGRYGKRIAGLPSNCYSPTPLLPILEEHGRWP